MKEVEAKFKIDDFSAIICKLSTMGAKYLGRFLQTDTFFDKSGEIVQAGAGLRIRNLAQIEDLALVSEQISAGKIIFDTISGIEREFSQVTYKGPVEENISAKVRAEYETEISDANMLAKIFDALGYKPAVTIQKRRSKFQLGSAHIELDELPMIGEFVEIEAESVEVVNTLASQLGIASEHLKRSYLHLLQKKAHQLGKPIDKILF